MSLARLSWLIGSTLAIGTALSAQQRVSRLGEYQGYSEPVYDSWVRSSQYVTMRDGVRLAVDIIRPARGGQVETKPLPVVWTHHRYQRASIRQDTVRSVIDWFGDMKLVLLHGYVIVAVDTRGGGASFGTQQGFFMPAEARDAYEITEWLARQPWSTGNIGMFGRSYLGITQYFAASERPPHLKAIFPEMAVFDWYPFIYPGGVYRDNFFASWQKLTYHLDRSLPLEWYNMVRVGGLAAPVDGDSGSTLRDLALKAHEQNRPMDEMWSGVPFRNSIDQITKQPIHRERSPSTYLAAINASGIPIYTQGGLFDAFPRDAVLWFNNLRVPQKLVLGPWYHTDRTVIDLGKERLRWYDYWLKGIQNGVMTEPRIHYWVLNAPEGTEWRTSNVWPLPNQQSTRFYFHQGPSGTIASKNDGKLATGNPPPEGRDKYEVDYTTTTGTANRWTNTYGGLKPYPDLRENDAKGLTYTTDPLPADLQVTGHPVVSLWVTSTVTDGDFFVYLEWVDETGKSMYLTEGVLRASHRRVGIAPYNAIGLPWHRSNREDLEPLSPRPNEIRFDLQPTSVLFRKGQRIRVTITNADRDNNLTPVLNPAPTIRLFRNSTHPSHIVLPVIPSAGAGGSRP